MGADGIRGGDHTAPLAPLPDHRNVSTAWWQELWRRHARITTPLRKRGLECDIEFGLSAYIVRVSLPDDSYLIIGPPQEPPSLRPPGDPEGWIVTREHPDDQALFEVIYDSASSADASSPQRPEARHGGSVRPLVAAIGHRLDQLGLVPNTTPAPKGTPSAGRPTVYGYGDAMRALTDRLHGAESHADAAALLHQVLDPFDGLLAQLGEFFEAAGEKAKEAEEDDGFDLYDDFAEAAAEIRNIGEVLHVAEDRMRALTPLAPAPQLTSTPAHMPPSPPRALPTARPRSAR
ncbi:hypothetical protein [Streptomyces sp. NPDC001828]|uniref:hypothetical protein n=1 Tax=Streptomyces sp. NPDC001828 TaxID=3364615 RepID=UPI0036AE095C